MHRLSYALFGIRHQYNADISFQLELLELLQLNLLIDRYYISSNLPICDPNFPLVWTN